MSDKKELTEEELIKEEKSKYTTKVYTPIYEPKGDSFPIKDLYDTTKRDELINEINEDKDLPDDLREFLLSAAERHTSFNFSRIAENYCHLPIKFKHHFENSALVIIDYDNAVRNGFVAFDKIAQESREDYLENVITKEKLLENRDEMAEKRIKKAQEELDYIKSKKKKSKKDLETLKKAEIEIDYDDDLGDF